MDAETRFNRNQSMARLAKGGKFSMTELKVFSHLNNS
jgi:hypothetical protein